MKNLRWILPSLALVLFAPGCILTSGQITIDFDLPDINATSSTGIVGEQIDLNDNGDYKDHKDDVKDIADFAVLGKFNNAGATDVDVEVYMTKDLTTLTDAGTIRSTGIKLWGPFHVAAGSSRTIDWTGSAALFHTAGKGALLGEAKGDGNFTLYAVGAAGSYQFNVENGELLIVIDAGI